MVRIISNNDNNNEIENSDGDANPSYDEDETRSGNVKKGPWTPLEDMILTEYVKKHGEGNWNSVQKNSGLLRCGKSCRLRWANHLRPDLKKGAFSDDEEKIIIELHAKLGNKWARMAAQLPGRTDNEIKNFWNTRVKRRQRQGLPIYPPEVVDAEATAYNNRLKQQQNFKKPFSSTSLQFSLLLNSCYPKKPNEPTHDSATNPIQNQQNSSASANHSTNPLSQFKLFNENSRNNETLALPLSPLSPISPISSISHYPSSSSNLLNQNFSAHNSAPNDTHDYQYSGSLSYDHGFIEGTMYEPLPLIHDSNTEISSSQTAHDSATPASSYASAVDGLMGSSTSSLVNNDYYEVAPLSSPEGNSGLLDALVKESNTLSRNENGKVSYKRKYMEADEHVEEEGTFPAMKKINSGDSTTDEVSKGKKQVVEDPFALGEMNSMDDDLFSLLNNFPSEMPTPEWYRRGKTQSLGLENETEASSSSGPTNQEFAWTLGTCWNNMPGIC